MKLLCLFLSIMISLPFCFKTTAYVSSDTHTVETDLANLVIPASLTFTDPFEGGPKWTDASKLIAHAGGSIHGTTGTNTIEAVEHNYMHGHRVFELDFNLTSDNVLAAVHDWGVPNIARTWREFSAVMIYGRYTPSSFDDFIRFLSTNRDTYLVTDTKSFELSDEEITKQFEVMYSVTERVDPSTRERIVIQVYNQNMYHLINKIYKYPNIIYTLYATPDSEEEVLRFIDAEKILVIAMPPERANQQFLDKLLALNVRVYLHTLNDIEDVRQWQRKGVWGVYTDTLWPIDIPEY